MKAVANCSRDDGERASTGRTSISRTLTTAIPQSSPIRLSPRYASASNLCLEMFCQRKTAERCQR
ncbi:hypothetical protein KCP78_10725 [Salmonella enterica subsp. enterica]|nr:hypothetical protein KCP78_10725 [Salmonella enterica subsp. enterica]